MKKFLVLSALMLGSVAAQAHDQWSVGISVGNPYPYAAPPVRYYAPPPAVYYAPPVTYYAPPPVIYPHPQSRYYGSQTYAYPPAIPGVIQFSYGSGYGGGNWGHHHHGGGDWGRGNWGHGGHHGGHH